MAELDRLAQPVGQPAAGAPDHRYGGGVGKTALALRWAHRRRDLFPDGQLYLDLRGYGPEQPMRPVDALRRMLRALGLPGEQVPLEVEECAAGFRSLIDGRRMLVVLDNAASVEQVRHLLPGSSSCLVVVTSRDAQAGLVARHGAARMVLDLLDEGEAVALLHALIGARVAAEPQAAATLAARCARLPLALRVVAELALARPDTSLAELAGDLADHRDRLALLDAAGDRHTGVGSVLQWSYRDLAPSTAAAFGLLALHPGADFDRHVAAALTGVGTPAVDQVLDRLTRAHLVQRDDSGRYRMHELLRAHARGLSGGIDSAAGRAAGTRLLDHYLAATAAAIDTLHPAGRPCRPDSGTHPLSHAGLSGRGERAGLARRRAGQSAGGGAARRRARLARARGPAAPHARSSIFDVRSVRLHFPMEAPMHRTVPRRRRWAAIAAALGLFLSFFAATSATPAFAAAGTFRNPVGTGPDPFMTYFNGNYYLLMTEGDAIRIRRSRSVATLLNAPAIQVWRDTDPARNQHVWAPELYRVNNRWYLYYTADNGVDENHRLFVLESAGDDPAKPVPVQGPAGAAQPRRVRHRRRAHAAQRLGCT
nr:hypothetical protein GCM10020092_075320 [Actinoplanes digitatis]